MIEESPVAVRDYHSLTLGQARKVRREREEREMKQKSASRAQTGFFFFLFPLFSPSSSPNYAIKFKYVIEGKDRRA